MIEMEINVFDEKHHSGVYQRVMDKLDCVKKIYQNPIKYNEEELEHHTPVALPELALEEVRKVKYPNYPSRMSSLYVSKTLEEDEMISQKTGLPLEKVKLLRQK